MRNQDYSRPLLKTKSAFVSPKQKKDIRGKLCPITHKDLDLNVEDMFNEVDMMFSKENNPSLLKSQDISGSYKTFAKWEMDFGAEDEIQ